MAEYELVIRAERVVTPDGRPSGNGRRPRRADRRDRGPRGGPGRGRDRGTARFRGAAARPGGHPRARQRAGPHRVGGVRHRDAGRRRGRGHHPDRHAAELLPPTTTAAALAEQAGRRPAVRARGRRVSGAARCPATWATWPGCTRPGCSASRRSSPTPGCPSSPCSTRSGLMRLSPRPPSSARCSSCTPRIRTSWRPPGSGGPGVRRLPGVPARGGRGRRHRGAAGRRRLARRPGAHPAPGLRRALPLIAAARADGVRVTAETCPHYLTFCAEEVPDGATEYKCCPPIRDAANRDRLWAGLAAA